jgi:hypothetical protein
MLRLIPSREDLDAQEASIRIRWCLDRPQAEVIAGLQQVPWVCIVVWNVAKQREMRFVEKLDALMTRITFPGPGQNIVLAAVMWGDGDGRRMVSWLREKANTRYYENRVLANPDFTGGKIEFRDMQIIGPGISEVECFHGRDTECDDQRHHEARERNKQVREDWIAESWNVEVPAEMFAKEPPPWLVAWVNRHVEGHLRDECHLRRRAIYAFTIQPVLCLLYIIGRFSVGLLWYIGNLLFGMRGLSFEAVWRIYSKDMDDIKGDVPYSNVFLFDLNPELRREKYLFARWWLWPLTPIYWMLAGAIITTVLAIEELPDKHVVFHGFSMMEFAKYALYVVAGSYAATLGVIALVAIAGLIVVGFSTIFRALGRVLRIRERIENRLEQIDAWLTKKFPPKPRKGESYSLPVRPVVDRDTLDHLAIVCQSGLRPDIRDLPKQRQTIHLRFLDLKAKVCRPFAA